MLTLRNETRGQVKLKQECSHFEWSNELPYLNAKFLFKLRQSMTFNLDTETPKIRLCPLCTDKTQN